MLEDLIAALRKEGGDDLADEITVLQHLALRYTALRWCYLHDHRIDVTPESLAEYDEAADQYVHRYEDAHH